uniref:Uncharacterized protein n=1 Tax=Peronospora matthiolae TaxID=2874970 RepID=A0AAV1VL71_9STRA
MNSMDPLLATANPNAQLARVANTRAATRSTVAHFTPPPSFGRRALALIGRSEAVATALDGLSQGCKTEDREQENSCSSVDQRYREISSTCVRMKKKKERCRVEATSGVHPAFLSMVHPQFKSSSTTQ